MEGNPVLRVEGWASRIAELRILDGSGTSVLAFRYVVATGDRAPAGIRIESNALDLNGGSIKDEHGRMADLSHPSLKANRNHRVLGASDHVLSPAKLIRCRRMVEGFLGVPGGHPVGEIPDRVLDAVFADISVHLPLVDSSIDWRDWERAWAYATGGRRLGSNTRLVDVVCSDVSWSVKSMESGFSSQGPVQCHFEPFGRNEASGSR